MKRATLSAFSVLILAFAAPAGVTISPGEAVGPIKRMNAVNNGPVPTPSDQSRGNAEEFAYLKIPFARTHDAAFCASYGGPHTVDVTAIFPDFNADENDPKSYDFHFTDEYLATIFAAGTEPYFRLGQSIEHGSKKYGVLAPKDPAKWARIAEHIIRHYTEGWADGKTWKIRYWEIWNEFDLSVGYSEHPDQWPKNAPTWLGTERQFRTFFETAAKHLKAKFPNLKIGGPAFCTVDREYVREFLKDMKGRGVELDFVSWHNYNSNARVLMDKARYARKAMDDAGYTNAESHLTEYNYARGWTVGFPYTVDSIRNAKGAAFVAQAMCEGQHAPLDLLMYYDARPSCFNGIWDSNFRTCPAYSAFLAWSKLADLGTEVSSSVSGEIKDLTVGIDTAKPDGGGLKRETQPLEKFLSCVAAKKGDRLAVLASFFNDSDDDVEPRVHDFRLTSGRWSHPVCRVTDAFRNGLESPYRLSADGRTLSVKLEPRGFVLIEDTLAK